MVKNFLFAMTLLSLALATGCATGGNGVVPEVSVAITSPANLNPGDIYPTQSVTLTATVTGTGNMAVTWTATGGGTITSVTPLTATYVAPATATSSVTVTATLTSNSSVTGNLPLTVVDVTTEVAPFTLSVGNGLTQQFTAVAVPDDVPQTLTWNCTANGVRCASFAQDPNVSGLAYYKAEDNCTGSCIQISAASTLDPSGCSPNPKYCTIAKASLVTSRVSGTYAFRFSGYDSSNHATAVVGMFTASNGTISSGIEDELTSSGPAQYSITGGSYTPTSSDPNNSNNAGTLTLTTGAYPDKFQVVLDGAGDIEMIESDGHGTGSGIAQVSAGAGPFKGDQTYAFGFTGVDSGLNRVGYVGLLPMNGSGMIVSGQMDVNDNGNDTNICGSGPCSITTGSYTAGSGFWHMILTTSGATLGFDFFVSSGGASKTTPLTFYAISTDAIDATHPAVSGTMVLQDSTQTYNNAAFSGTSVSALTGVNGANTNVSLTLGTTDGNGNFFGQFDQNNAGTILAAAAFPPASSNHYTYAASGSNGRYTFNMLGNPTASPVVAPLPFILYASGQNRGFLLDQSSSSVMTGAMNPQGKGSGAFANSELPGTYGAATISSGSSAVSPIAANLILTLLTPAGGGVETFNVSGTQYPGPQTVTGIYDLSGAAGAGTGPITLTAPSAENYVIYVLDTTGCTGNSPVCAIEDFLMMDETTTPNPNKNASIIFSKE
jgi:hypothetical protein